MNPSINALKASDGSGNASVATVSNTRAPLATTIQVDTVQGINNDFFGTMGTPHTFTDPVTGETITVISEATAVDFRGHVDGSNLEIDEIAPGYTDAGSSVGDIVVIRPTTQWGDQVTEVLEVSHNDDGTLKSKPVNAAIQPQQGFMINGKIVRSVSSNNITVAVKTLAGNDPSTSDPVYVRIGDTVRAITAALSVTKNAGTNWMDLGSAQHATQDVDVFVYLGYNATDGVTIGFSRIPYARTYSDFSATTTNEKYAAISVITNATANDIYENVGRVNVTLGATTSFNWSVPATSIIVNRPTFQTRWLNYVPTLTNFTGTINVAKYQLSVQKCDLYLKITQGASVTGNHTFSLPIATNTDYAIIAPIHSLLRGYIQDLGTAQYPAETQLINSTTLALLCISAAGTYTVPTATSGTVPMTWVNGQDSFILEGSYPL